MSSAAASEGNRNLARIRDNQRRSRARKKEYVDELEQRIRDFEQRGVQATAEVQVAARKVAEENKKLRALLRLHGVSEAGIQEYLAAEETSQSHGYASRPQQQQPQQHPQECSKSPNQPDPDEEHDCSAAADLISLMTGTNPHEVRASLGCAPGTDCRVNDNIVGDAINRLTTGS
ncbi:hypothetical protein QBC44DRAFT_297851 [Cladorrhinum sp. PSN332]|nr:hypothetical protein QBC44DRAFT_297851 [Cladorrhinum sp. PSN332]